MTSWRAENFDLLPQSVAQRWSSFGAWPTASEIACAVQAWLAGQ